jgi:flagellar motor switch protein FliN/FliY
MSETAVTASQSSGYIRIWAESFSKAMTQIAGPSVSSMVQAEPPAGLSPPGEQDLWALLTSSGGLRGEMRLRLPAAAALHLAQVFTGEASTPETPFTEEHKEAVLELLRQVAGLVSSAGKSRFGENQIRVEMAPAAPSWPPAETFWLQIGEDGPGALGLEAGFSAALTAELRSEKTSTSGEASLAPAAAPGGEAGAAPGTSPGAMDVLMGVQLGVTLRFGSRHLRLREVLELSPGAVVELDRKVQEPVDLLLEGRLVARGEVVVMDGNYGFRVTDASPLKASPSSVLSSHVASAQRAGGRDGG